MGGDEGGEGGCEALVSDIVDTKMSCFSIHSKSESWEGYHSKIKTKQKYKYIHRQQLRDVWVYRLFNFENPG